MSRGRVSSAEYGDIFRAHTVLFLGEGEVLGFASGEKDPIVRRCIRDQVRVFVVSITTPISASISDFRLSFFSFVVSL